MNGYSCEPSPIIDISKAPVLSIPPCTPSLWHPWLLLLLSLCSCLSRTPCKWNHAICNLLCWLLSLNITHVKLIHVVVQIRLKHRSHPAVQRHQLICSWTLGCFQLEWFWMLLLCRHLCSGFYLDIYPHFFWVNKCDFWATWEVYVWFYKEPGKLFLNSLYSFSFPEYETPVAVRCY